MDWEKSTPLVVVPPWIVHRDKYLGLESCDLEMSKIEREKSWFNRANFMDLELGFQPTYFRSSTGGGVVDVGYDLESWSVYMVVAWIGNRNTSYNPLGFSCDFQDSLRVIVPVVGATHRAKETPMPLAPSPMFTVEPESAAGLEVLLRFTKRSSVAGAAAEFCRILGEWGVRAELVTMDEPINDRAAGCRLPREFVVARICLASVSHSLWRVFAFVVFAGIAVHSSVRGLWVVSLCGPFKTMPLGARRVAQIPPRATPTRTADDW